MEEFLFFSSHPQLFALYESLRDLLTARYPEMEIRAAKTQISFYDRHMFAMVSLPVRRRKGWPKDFLMVSFGLARQEASPRISACSQPYPGRLRTMSSWKAKRSLTTN